MILARKFDTSVTNYPVKHLNRSVAMVFFKTYVAIGGGVNDPPDVSRVLSHLELKFQQLYPCFRG